MRARTFPCSPPSSTALHPLTGCLSEKVEVHLVFVSGCFVRFAALLGFENEMSLFIAVDPAEALGAVTVVLKDPTLKYVVVQCVVSS